MGWMGRIAIGVALSLNCIGGASTDSGGALDAILEAYASTPGVAVEVRRGGQRLYRRAVGLANLQSGTKVAPTTRFELASVSKQFTALAVMLLERAGKLRYDDVVSRFLPELGAFAKDVTVRHLLQHTAGFPDYMELCAQGRTIHNADVLKLVNEKGALIFPPGTRHDYSNTGYSLLALVIERASGMAYPDFMKARIFERLGMRDTFVNVWAFPPIPNVALSYSAKPALTPFDGPAIRDCNTVYGDGSIFSSLDDMVVWSDALDRAKLLDATAFAEAMLPTKLASGEKVEYGFGWRLESIDGRRAIHHGGAWAGYRNHVIRLLDDGLRVVILSNYEGLSSGELGRKIVSLFAK